MTIMPPSVIVNPTTKPERIIWGEDLDTALAEVRRIAETPVPLPRSARFNIDTALTLAEKAPELYAMGDGTRGRFTLIATFLRDALAEIDQPVQR